MGRALDELHVTAPASSANLGPGFDTLGLALDLPFELATAEALQRYDQRRSDPGMRSDTERQIDTARYLRVEPTHPAFVAYVAGGGDESRVLMWRSPIPPGRGLGFSGAARVAGAFLGGVESGLSEIEARIHAFRLASSLEGHADNAAASAFGGFCVAGAGGAIRVDPPGSMLDDLAVITWSPESTTSTNAARAKLPSQVPFEVAAQSIQGSSTWVAAIATGQLDVVRAACEDRLHQPFRLESRPDSARSLAAMLEDRRVLAAWLSGSGPSVAALVPHEDAPRVESDLVATVDGGRLRTLSIAGRGVRKID